MAKKTQHIQEQRYLVIVADRQYGKYFPMNRNTWEDKGGEVCDANVPQKVKAEGFRTGRIGNHIRDHLHRHLKNVGVKALEYTRKKNIPINGVILGGHDEMLSTIKRLLPQDLRKLVIARFVSSISLPVGELALLAGKALHPEKDTGGDKGMQYQFD